MNSLPLHQKLSRLLRHELQLHPLAGGSCFYTARELADLHHVSLPTANRVLDDLAAEGVIGRRRGIGNYVRGSSGGVRITYCGHKQFIMGMSYEQNMQKIFEDGLWDDLRQRGHHLNFFDISGDEDWVIPREILAGTDVILTLNGYMTPEVEAFLRDTGLPVIVRGESFAGPWHFHQIVNSLSSALGEFFRKFGCLLRKPVVILTAEYPDTMFRAESFMREAVLHGPENISLDLRKLVIPGNDSGRLCGYQYGMDHGGELLDHLVVVTSDFLAVGLMEALDRLKICAGRDYYLLGYDDLEGRGYNVFGHPRISSIGYDMKQCAGSLDRLIMQAVRNDDGMVYTCQMPTRLVVRESLGGA